MASAIQELQSLIQRLQKERQAHVEAIDRIDGVFMSFGIGSGVKRRGRPRGSRNKKSGKKVRARRKFKTSGSQSILDFVKRSGRKGVTGSQITKHWNSEGRGAGCYNIMGQLVKTKKIRRQPLKGQRGSSYTC